jgi:glycerol kinase
MATAPLTLVLDAGTTSTRAILFSARGEMLFVENRLISQHFPEPGWVEHDAMEICASSIDALRTVLKNAGANIHNIVGLGITNQRETIVLWDRKTGVPLHRAIVWQDRRTSALCEQLRAESRESLVQTRTGLRLDPYFSGTKIAWLLDHIPGARARAAAGELAVGTIESFLIWQLSGGLHISDATNASRTMLYNINKGEWDHELCAMLNIPIAILPEVTDCAGQFGVTQRDILGYEIPIAGIAGDQQAAAIGQSCFSRGMAKCTYGTGAFVLAQAGTSVPTSNNNLLSTVAWQLQGVRHYALEGSLFVAGSAVQWLRDGLGIVETAAQTEALAQSVNDSAGVYFVPAFAGLGAPYWDANARGLICGLTRGTTRAHIVRACLEAMSYQTADLLSAFAADGLAVERLRVDGGMAANNWLMQDVADITGVQIDRPRVLETTAWGAAILAMIGAGVATTLEDAAKLWTLDKSWYPEITSENRHQLLSGWTRAVARSRSDPHA